MDAKTLLLYLHWPHYINSVTKSKVLAQYKRAYKSSRLFFDPLCRKFLQQHLYETYLKWKYVTDVNKIEGLVHEAEPIISQLQLTAATCAQKLNQRTPSYVQHYGDGTQVVRDNSAGIKAILAVLDYAGSHYKLKESPIRSLVGRTRWAQLKQQNKLSGELAADSSHLAYKIANMQVPTVRTLGAHREQLASREVLFYQYLAALGKAKIKTSRSGNQKLFLKFEVKATVLGTPIAHSRTRNEFRKYFTHLDKHMPRPYHEEFMAHALDQFNSKQEVQRFFRHRWRTILGRSFSITRDSENGDMSIVFQKIAIPSPYHSFYSGLGQRKASTNANDAKRASPDRNGPSGPNGPKEANSNFKDSKDASLG